MRLKQKIISIVICSLPLIATGATTVNTQILPITAPTTPISYPIGQQLYDQYPWSGTIYYGITCSDPLARIVRGQCDRWPEDIGSAEISRTLDPNNFLRRLVSPLVGVVQLAGNIALRKGSNEHTIYEINPYLAFRWANLPWNKYLNTSLAIGEGISYDTSVQSLESKSSDHTKRLLNYLMLEATFAAPEYPRWQLVARIHHRSGAYGLYHAGNTGSNDIGLGLRYLFD